MKIDLVKIIILACANWSSVVIVFQTIFCFVVFFQQSTLVGLISSLSSLFYKVSNDEVSSKLIYICGLDGPPLSWILHLPRDLALPS